MITNNQKLKIDSIVNPNSNLNDSRLLQYDIELYLILDDIISNNKDISNDYYFRSIFECLYGGGGFKTFNITQKDLFFKIFEDYRKKAKNSYSIDDVVNDLRVIRNDEQWSYSSKICHTLNHQRPIMDEKVRNFINDYYQRQYKIYDYDEYEKDFFNFMYSNDGKIILTSFKKYNKKRLNDIKIIDFVLWLLN